MLGTNQNGTISGLFMWIGIAELIVMAVSACAIVVSLIIWIATAVCSCLSE